LKPPHCDLIHQFIGDNSRTCRQSSTGLAQVGIDYPHIRSVMYIQRNPIEIRTQHTGTWPVAAWPPCPQTYRPGAFFFSNFSFIALSFLQG